MTTPAVLPLASDRRLLMSSDRRLTELVVMALQPPLSPSPQSMAGDTNMHLPDVGGERDEHSHPGK